ncbi:syntaxin-8 [Anastrepha obliqua]|uniref:syntaxin-8 n=1 Tax=Anastrepha obliqua TaxID=95512 RepID=UPI00240A7D27|nr:syntaxin-8 [Anastrepha obliqua]
MSLLEVDSWSRECEACSTLSESIKLKLAQREKGQKNSVQYNRLTAAIQTELKQFEGEVKELKQKLRLLEDAQSIAPEEVILRKQQVDALQAQLAQVHRKITQDTNWERAELFAQSPVDTDRAGTSTENAFPTNNLSDVNALKQRQIDILERQNRGLEILSQTISRQKNLASQLGQEVGNQNDILDNLADTMERVDAHVHVETGNISEVNRRDSTWGYWLIIIVLFVAILIVAVV